MAQDHKIVETIYNAAVLLTSTEDRAAYIDIACGNNSDLRHRVEVLLHTHADSTAGTAPIFETSEKSTFDGANAQLGEKPGDVIGCYRLVQTLGEGGFGTVYLAEQSHPVRREVALKVIKVGMDTKEVMFRFEMERQTLALMDHPNIAKVFDAGATETGRPYFVMELVRGIPITEYCDQGRLNTKDRLALFMTVCSAVEHAHQKGVIHRDLKPSNVLVVDRSGTPAPQVIDFGIAKATRNQFTDQAAFTHAFQMLGTPAYMSPEQAGTSGLDIDTRSDIYSLGVLLYELLTGHTPFEAKDLAGSGYEDLRRNIREKEPPKPSTRLSLLTEDNRKKVAARRSADPARLNTILRQDLDWIVMKAIEKDRALRYESATAFADDLKRYLNHEPVRAAAPSTTYRFRKFAKRNRGLLTAVAGITAALIAGSGLSVWQAVRATKNKNWAIIQTGIARQASMDLENQARLAELERNKAQQAEAETRRVFSRSDFQIGDQLLERGRVGDAVAHLARAVRFDPGNHSAAVRLLTSLADGNFLGPPLKIQFPSATDAEKQPEWTGPLTSAIGPDGSIAAIARGHQILLFATETGDPVSSMLQCGHPVAAMAIAPDNRWLIAGLKNAEVQVWDIQTGQKTDQIFKAASSEDLKLGLSPDGRKLVIASTWGTFPRSPVVRVFDRVSGENLFEFETGQIFAVPVWSFGHDGSWLAVARHSGNANGYVIHGFEKGITQTFPAESRIRQFAVSPDNSRLIMSSFDGVVQVRESQTGKALAEFKGQTDIAGQIALTPAGSRILITSSDSTVRILDLATCSELVPALRQSARAGTANQIAQHEPIINIVGISPDGFRAATLTDHQLRIWSPVTGELLAGPEESGMGPLTEGKFNSDGSKLILWGGEGIEIWTMNTPAILPTRFHQEGFVSDQTMAPGGAWIATTFPDRTVRLWDPSTGNERIPPLIHPANVRLLVNSADGSSLATVADTAIRVWDTRTGDLRAEFPADGTVRELHLSRQGHRVWARTMDFSRRQSMALEAWKIWDVGEATLIYPNESSGFLSGLDRISKDGRLAATAEPDGLGVMDLDTLEAIGPKLQNQQLAAISADGSRLATFNNRHILIWDSKTGNPVGQPIPMPGRPAESQSDPVVFTPDLSMLLVLNADRRISIYETSTGRLKGQPIRLGELPVMEAISTDSRYLLTSQVASSGRSSRIWEITTGLPLTAELPHGYQSFGQGNPRIRSMLPSVRILDLPLGDLEIPEWFPGFAEALVGRRFTADGVMEFIDGAERRRLFKEAAGRKSSDTLGRWSHWLTRNPNERSNSPLSHLRIDEFIENLRPTHHTRTEDAWAGTLIAGREVSIATTNELRQVLSQFPMQPLALAEYGVQLARNPDPLSRAEADWYTWKATELAPDTASVWLRRARFLIQIVDQEGALSALNHGLRADPSQSSLLALKGRVQLDMGQPKEAVENLTVAMARTHALQDLSNQARRATLGDRAQALQAQGRFTEALVDFLESKGIPPRPPGLPREQIDLSPVYNAGLDETRLPLLTGRIFAPMEYEFVEGNDLSPLPKGDVQMGGISFDARGVIQLSSTLLERLAPGKWPKEVKDIQINQTAGRLHFLMGVGTTRRMQGDRNHSFAFARMAGAAPPVLPPMTELARFEVRYEGGIRREIPIQFHKDILDVRMFAIDEFPIVENPPSEPGYHPLWTGVNPAGVRCMLGRFTWENPHPGLQIESIQFSSAMTEGSPFLIALTLEPLSSYITDLDAYVRGLIKEGSFESVGKAWELSSELTEGLIEDALHEKTDNPLVWLHEGFLKLHQGKHELAGIAFQRVLDSPQHDPALERTRSLAARYRTQSLLALGRKIEAAHENCLALGIPERSKEATASEIDLSIHYNGALTKYWLSPGSVEKNDLSSLAPFGIKDLGGVRFDVRGVVQLANADLALLDTFPSRVDGIGINQKCQKIHLLQAAGWGNGPSGLTAGHFQVHYANGMQLQIPIRLGEELWDWWHVPAPTIPPPPPPDLSRMPDSESPAPTEATRRQTPSKAEIVWTGSNEFAAQFKATIELFKTTWINPHPEFAIEAMDYVSKQTSVAPFLIAISVE